MSHHEPAHPRVKSVEINPRAGNAGEIKSEGGMTKRELIAAMAMQGMCSFETDLDKASAFHKFLKDQGSSLDSVIAQSAVKLADALLVELAKP